MEVPTSCTARDPQPFGLPLLPVFPHLADSLGRVLPVYEVLGTSLNPEGLTKVD